MFNVLLVFSFLICRHEYQPTGIKSNDMDICLIINICGICFIIEERTYLHKICMLGPRRFHIRFHAAKKYDCSLNFELNYI